MNRDYRESWLKTQITNNSTEEDDMRYSAKYPQNINYREFMTYMCYPTFTYQDSYPT